MRDDAASVMTDNPPSRRKYTACPALALALPRQDGEWGYKPVLNMPASVLIVARLHFAAVPGLPVADPAHPFGVLAARCGQGHRNVAASTRAQAR